MIDEFLKWQHLVEARANELSQEMIKELMASREKLLGKIAAISEKIDNWQDASLSKRKQYLDRQRQEIEKVLRQIYSDFGKEIKTAGEDTIQASGKAATMIMNKGLGLDVKFFSLDKALIQAWFESSTVEGLLISDWLAKIEKTAADRIVSVGRQAMIEGLTTSKTASLLRHRGLEGSRPGIQGLARTVIHSASSYGREQTIMNQFGKDIKGWRYFATLDRRTCLACGDLDHQFFKVDEVKPILPLHWRCRCVYVPIPKAPKGVDTSTDPDRAAVKHWPPKIVHHRDGSISTKWGGYDAERFPGSYNQWLKQQLTEDPAFVKSILGAGRFELFKAGKITLGQMSVNGRIKRLKELI